MKDYFFLFELEKQLHLPKTRSDKQELMKLLAPDFFEFGSSGKKWSREDIVERLPFERDQYQIQSSDYKATFLAAGVVLVTYISKRNEESYLRSSIWREIDNNWQMVFHQGTRKAS